LSSERVRAFFESFKAQHTNQAIDQVKEIVQQSYQVAVNNFLWAKSSPDNDLRRYFLCIENQSTKLGFTLTTPSDTSGSNSGNAPSTSAPYSSSGISSQ
jgi:hypothetical protein